jgi:hypothetical protein
MELSPWFEFAKDKPLRIGYYQCNCCLNKFFWSGKNWLPHEKYRGKHKDSDLIQVPVWRGIIK